MRKQLQTVSESAFERFLQDNSLEFERIDEADSSRPDYLVEIRGARVIFEVKEIEGSENGSNRIIGDHVRRKINEARKQVRYATEQGIPSVLLIYNKNRIDHLFSFAIEDHDFTTAMYGEYTLVLDRSRGAIVDHFYGRNQSMREGTNVEFSAVGRLESCSGEMVVTLFENVFSRVRLPYEKLPACFSVRRISIDYSA